MRGIVRGAKSSAISYDHIAKYCRLQSAVDSDRIFKVPESLCFQALFVFFLYMEVLGQLSGRIAPGHIKILRCGTRNSKKRFSLHIAERSVIMSDF